LRWSRHLLAPGCIGVVKSQKKAGKVHTVKSCKNGRLATSIEIPSREIFGCFSKKVD
jgi:hypothetical protein